MEIKIKNLKFSYSKINYEEKNIFDNMSCSFKDAKVNSIIGKNGVGKSTLLNIIALNLIPNKGTIDIGDIHLNKKSEKYILEKCKNMIGILPQEIDFVSDEVLEELEYSLISHQFKSNNYQKRMIDSLIMANLDPSIISKKISELSNMEKRKLSLALLLSYNPKVILLDDPTKNMDELNKKALINLIHVLKNKYKKNIIIASNDQDFLYKVTDNYYLINNNAIELNFKKEDFPKFIPKLEELNINLPHTIDFSNIVLKEKKIKIGYRDEINDLIKDIYRFVK